MKPLGVGLVTLGVLIATAGGQGFDGMGRPGAAMAHWSGWTVIPMFLGALVVIIGVAVLAEALLRRR